MNQAAGQTLRIARALAWEFWARSWANIVLAPVGALALPGFLFILLISGGAAQAQQIMRSFLVPLPFYWITVLLLGTVIFLNLQNPSRRYTLPASSFLLVAVPMACAMLAMFVQYSIVAMILNAAFDAGWAIVGPGLLAAVMVAWCQAVQWSTSNSLGLPFLGCLSSFITLVFVAVRWTPRRDLKMTEFLQALSGCQALGFGLAALACVGLGTVGFALLRRNSGLDGKRIVDWLSRRLWFRSATRAIPFSSPTKAQFWLEWNWHGYALPLGTTPVGIAALPLAYYFSPPELDPGKATHIAGGVSVLFVVPLYLIGFFWGNRSPNFEFGPFGGSRPQSDGQIAAAVLKSATLSLILSAAIWAACLALIILILGGRGEISWLYFKAQRPDVFIGPLIVLAAWSAVGCMTSLALAGRKAMGVAFGLVFGLWVVGVFLSETLPHGFRKDFSAAYSFGCFALCVLVAWGAFVMSGRRHLISWPALVLAAALILTAAAPIYFTQPVPDWKSVLFFLCGCSLIPLPIAAAPLAVYVNRHR